MRSKSQPKGLFINCPVPFRLQQLPLARQKKDKQIKQQRLQLQKKRKQYEDLQLHWKVSQSQFRQFSLHRQQENSVLKLKQFKLRKDLFKLTIRRDQIESRSNPAISEIRAKVLKQYLLCAPYSVGNRFQCIQFWQSQIRFMHLKFILESTLDRCLGRTEVQKCIKNNLNCIVLCNKVKLNDQLIMVCIKVIGQNQQIRRKNNNRHWNSVKKGNNNFQVMVYAITSPYFCLKKIYSYESLIKFAVSLGSIISLKLNKHRLSVADNIAKVSALRSLADGALQKSESSCKISSPKISYQLISQSKIIKEGVNQGMSEESNYSEHESLAEKEKVFHGLTQKLSPPSDEQMQQSSKNVISEESSQQSQKEKQPCQTKKQLCSKSSFYPKAKSNDKKVCPFNKEFLMGHQEVLFPQNQPLLNLVVLTNKNQLYLLPEYIQIPKKRFLLDQSLAKFRLKMKLKAELRKCLLYKIVYLDKFYETEMLLEQHLSMKFLFVLKRQDTLEARQINMYCNSIRSDEKFKTAIMIKTNIQRQVIDRTVEKEEKNNNRNSNNRGLRKESSRRSRDSKRKSTPKNQAKLPINQHQKSNFMNGNKFGIEGWTPFSSEVIEKLQQFLKNNVLSIYLKKFIPVMSLTIKKQSVIKIQASAKRFICRNQYLKTIANIKIVCNYHPLDRVLISCLSIPNQKIIIVYVQSLELGKQEKIKALNFNIQYSEIVFKAVKSFHNQGPLTKVKEDISWLIDNNIKIYTQEKARKQRERPEKNKRVLHRFLFLAYLRLKARKNLFLVKKITIRQKLFLLIIRRDSQIRSLLQCNLYEISNLSISQGLIIGSISSGKQNKDIGSQYGFHKPFPHSSRDLMSRNHRYQTIYLMDQYFLGIDKKNIVQEFFIDRGVFLLKPQKSASVYYIERLSSIDINSDEIAKEIYVFQRQEQSQLYKHSNQSAMLQTNLSFKKTSPSHLHMHRVSSNLRFNQKLTKQTPHKRVEDKIKGKKTSIDGGELAGLSFARPSLLLKDTISNEHHSRVSMVDMGSHKSTKQIFKIIGNSHQSTVYYSLFKSQDIFFYLEFFIVSKVKNQKGYSQQLASIDKQRLYKKQLEQHGMALIPKRLANWIHQNEGECIQIKQIKDRIGEVSRKDFEELHL